MEIPDANWWNILLTGALGWVGVKSRKIDDNASNLDKYKLYVAETYENKVTTQSSLSRLHDRIDTVQESVDRLPERILRLIDHNKGSAK